MSVYKAMVKELLDDQADITAEQAERHVQARQCKVKPIGRGGKRSGAGRKKMKPELKKVRKTYSLSTHAVDILECLENVLDFSCQSSVIEFLARRAKIDILDVS